VEVWLGVAAWIAGIAAALLGLFGLARKLWQLNSAVVSTVNLIGGLPARLDKIDETLAAQDEKIEEIHHQTHENDGGSLKDANKRVETKLGDVAKTQKSMIATQARMERGIKGLYDRVDVTDERARELRKDLEDTRPVKPRARAQKPTTKKETP